MIYIPSLPGLYGIPKRLSDDHQHRYYTGHCPECVMSQGYARYCLCYTQCALNHGKFPIFLLICNSKLRIGSGGTAYRDLSTLARISPGLLVVPCPLKSLLVPAFAFPSKGQISICLHIYNCWNCFLEDVHGVFIFLFILEKHSNSNCCVETRYRYLS